MAIPRAVGRFNKHVTNRLTVHLVGHASFVELEHVGRRTGRVRRVPLNAFRAGDRLTIALTYGPDVDWLRNVRAAGGCRVRTGREIVTTGAPTDLPTSVGLARMPVAARLPLRLLRVEHFVELPVLGSRPVDEQR